jgi:hypothetical protein
MEEMEDTLLALVMALKVRITCAHSLHSKHLAIHVAQHLQKCTSPLNRCPPTHSRTKPHARPLSSRPSPARSLA